MLDLLLLACLLIILPGRTLWRSLKRPAAPALDATSKVGGRLEIALIAGGLTTLLAVDWAMHGRTLAELGLAIPLSRMGLIGMAIAATVLGGLAIATWFGVGQSSSAGKAPPAFFPTRRDELLPFLTYVVAIVIAWEVLFRGFLLWRLAPSIGTPAAVLIAAAAYAISHGAKTRNQMVGTVLAALAFTTAYALTQSLWWLIAIHGGLPLLVGALLGLRPAPAAPAAID